VPNSYAELVASATTPQDLQAALELIEEAERQALAAAEQQREWTVRTLADVARFFGVATQTVKQWRIDPEPMPGEEGAWPLAEIVRWKLAKATAQARPAEGGVESRTKQIELERRQLKLAKERGELVSRVAAQQAIAGMFARLRTRLEALPDQLATRPSERPEELRTYCASRIHQLCKELANWQFAEEVK
jgi:hypothetical protein